MIHRLFGLKPSLRYIPKSSVNSIVVSRTNLVKYLHSLGLPIGNKIKQGLDIPDWIKRNQKFSLACIRGLVDTDGSIFTHSYKVNGKKYQYKKLCFTTASEPLLHSVYETLRGRGFVVRLVKRGKREVRIDGVEYMKRYLELVGSHNPKHLKRYGE
jgi:intein/homing endonuclease